MYHVRVDCVCTRKTEALQTTANSYAAKRGQESQAQGATTRTAHNERMEAGVSETPETDAAWLRALELQETDIAMACGMKLERERDLLRRQVAEKDQRIEWLEKRDLKATIELCYADGQHPYERERLKVVDVGVADNIYVVHSEVVGLLRRQVDALATSLTEAANELVPYGGYSYHIKKWREQIKQVKNGGGDPSPQASRISEQTGYADDGTDLRDFGDQ